MSTPSTASSVTTFLAPAAVPTGSRGRLYGGTSLALAYLAAGRTVPSDRALHSISGTFLRAGRSDVDLTCESQALRDGRSFSHRRVRVAQGPNSLFEATVGFRASPAKSNSKRTGISHSTAAPPTEVPQPADCPDREQERTKRLGLEWLEHPVNAVEVRVTDARHLMPEVKLPARATNWVRVPGSGELSAHQQTALLLYASDRSLLSTAALPHGILWSKSLAVTLNHSVWLHQTSNLEQWHLFVAESRIAVDGLSLIQLEIFDQDDRLVASAVQEALVQY